MAAIDSSGRPIREIGDIPIQMIVDAEHIGIRTIMPILVLVGLIGGFALGSMVAPMIDEAFSSLCLSIIFAIIGLAVMTQLGERVIKPNWSSGRELQVDRSQLVLIDRRRREPKATALRWAQRVSVHAWYFIVPTRRSRVQKGWYCTSVRLTQSDTEIILYAFLSPDIAQSLEHYPDWFVHLHSKKEREALTGVDPHRAAQQERFLRLENRRWLDGAELTAADFLAVMRLIDQHGFLASI